MTDGAAVEPMARLEQVDLLAARLIARTPEVRFALARSPEERDAVFRLRYQVVIERGWTPPAVMADGRERDADDDHAMLIAGWDGDRLVAAGRIIYPAADRRLPMERVFDLVAEPRGRVAHIDRLCVARPHRDPTHRVFAALLGRCWLEMRGHGFDRCCGIESAAMARLFRRLGLTVILRGPPRPFWSELRYPVLFDPAARDATERAPIGSGSLCDRIARGG